jgi:putative ABC transport system substrate-binding protein
MPTPRASGGPSVSGQLCNRCKTRASLPLDAICRPRDTPLWKLEASLPSAEIAGKRVALLGEIVPNLRRLAILANASSPIGVMETSETQLAAQTVGIDTVALAIRRAEEIAPAIEGIKGHADALYIASEALMNTNRFRINSLALDARLPTMHGEKGYVEAGGLMSYGASFTDMYRRAAEYVDKILRGAKAADLPVAQPTKFELAINAKIAKTLGLAVTDKLISLADEVVE